MNKTKLSFNSADSSIDESAGIVAKNKVVINLGLNYLDSEALSKLSGFECSFSQYTNNEMILKLMSGDSDIDIIICNADVLRQLKEKNLYVPIESKILKEHNEGCFEYMKKIVYSDNDEITAMVFQSLVSAIVYPKAVEDEIEFSLIDNIVTMDDFSDFIKNYDGMRKPYASILYLYRSSLISQYTKYYCDLASNKFDYETDLFRSIFAALYGDETGKEFYGKSLFPEMPTEPTAVDVDNFIPYEPIPYGMEYRHISKARYNLDELLLTEAYFYEYILNNQKQISDMRAMPFPKINESFEKNAGVSALFAVINPYSNNIPGAIKTLEVIAENRAKVDAWYGSCPFIKDDISEYGDEYQPETDFFKDFYNIAQNGYLEDYSVNSNYSNKYWYEYFHGRLTLDEAIAEHERVINIWLNE